MAGATTLAALEHRLDLDSIEDELCEVDPDEVDPASLNPEALDEFIEDRLVIAIHAQVRAERSATRTRSYDGTTLLSIQIYDEDLPKS